MKKPLITLVTDHEFFAKSEDGGQALFGEIESDDEEFFIRLHSWSSSKKHELMKQLKGKRIRVEIFVEEE